MQIHRTILGTYIARVGDGASFRKTHGKRQPRGVMSGVDEQHIYARNLEVPSGGGVGTARAIAHAYSVFATGGKELGLRLERTGWV